MQLVLDPYRFDVPVMENMFGDILSDLMVGLIGGLGFAPAGNIGPDAAMFEAVHGSAPDIASQGIANPIGGIRSAALMLSHSFDLQAEAAALEDAVTTVLARGLRTHDLVGSGDSGVSTLDFADAVAEAVARIGSASEQRVHAS